MQLCEVWRIRGVAKRPFRVGLAALLVFWGRGGGPFEGGRGGWLGPVGKKRGMKEGARGRLGGLR